MIYFILIYLAILCFLNIISSIIGLSFVNDDCPDKDLLNSLRTMLSVSVVFFTLYISVIICYKNCGYITRGYDIPWWLVILGFINLLFLLVLNSLCITKIQNCNNSTTGFKTISIMSICLIILYIVFLTIKYTQKIKLKKVA